MLIKARVRSGASWSDACILNLSSRGMMVTAPVAPSRGSYLEIRRGPYVIVARVVWADADRFGVRTQDVVAADGLINHPDRQAVAANSDGNGVIERRAAPRPSNVKFEVSRWRARAMELWTLALLGVIGAALAVEVINGLFAGPMAVVESALHKG